MKVLIVTIIKIKLLKQLLSLFPTWICDKQFLSSTCVTSFFFKEDAISFVFCFLIKCIGDTGLVDKSIWVSTAQFRTTPSVCGPCTFSTRYQQSLSLLKSLVPLLMHQNSTHCSRPCLHGHFILHFWGSLSNILKFISWLLVIHSFYV